MLPTYKFKRIQSVIRHYLNEQTKSIENTKKLIALDQLIEREALETYIQPIISLSNGSNLGYEVLNRPPHGTTFNSTEAFYDFVGQTENFAQFEQHCISLSTKRFGQYSAEMPNQLDTLIFLNIAPHALLKIEGWLPEFEALLSYYGILPSQIIFEMTEKQECPDYTVMEKTLLAFRKSGFRFAVDDAGSGYNSLKTILVIKPEFIKLDKSLVRFIDQHAEQQNIIQLLLEFSSKSGSKIVAEGIERPEEIEYLTIAGVHYGQGYAIGRPSPILSFSELIEKNGITIAQTHFEQRGV